MRQQIFFGILTLSAACLLGPPAAPAQDPTAPAGTRIISNELMDLLEAWSDPTASVEQVAVSSRPDVIEAYVPVAEAYHGGQRLADILAARLPLTWAESLAAFGGADGGELPPAARLLSYAMAGGGGEYRAWQAALATGGADFAAFVAGNHPDVLAESYRLDTSPARQGIGLLDFAAGHVAAGQVVALEIDGEIELGLVDCACLTLVSFASQPASDWIVEINEGFSFGVGSPPTEWHHVSDWMASRGAARELDFWRKSEQSAHQLDLAKTGNSSSMRVRMTCLRIQPEGSLELCHHANACQGKLTARLGYASRVHERHDGFGPSTTAAKALTADRARMAYEAPAPGPIVDLAVKGVAVGGELNWLSSLGTLAGQFLDPLPLTSAHAGTIFAAFLEQVLDDPAVSGSAGLILSGTAGGPGQGAKMQLIWDNTNQPIVLLQEQTHSFQLDTSSLVHGSGQGIVAETRNRLDSGFFMVGVARAYLCGPYVAQPAPQAFWNYDFSPGGPYTYDEMIDLVESFATPTLGQWVPNVATDIPGHYP